MTYDPDADTKPLIRPPRATVVTYDELRQDAWAKWDTQVSRAELMGRGPLAYGLEPDLKAPVSVIVKETERLENALNYILEPLFCDPEPRCLNCSPSCGGPFAEHHNNAAECSFEGGCGCKAYNEADEKEE